MNLAFRAEGNPINIPSQDTGQVDITLFILVTKSFWPPEHVHPVLDRTRQPLTGLECCPINSKPSNMPPRITLGGLSFAKKVKAKPNPPVLTSQHRLPSLSFPFCLAPHRSATPQ